MSCLPLLLSIELITITEMLYFLKFGCWGAHPDDVKDNMQTLLTDSKKDRLLYDVIGSLMQDDPARRPSAAQMLKVSLCFALFPALLTLVHSTSTGSMLALRKRH